MAGKARKSSKNWVIGGIVLGGLAAAAGAFGAKVGAEAAGVWMDRHHRFERAKKFRARLDALNAAEKAGGPTVSKAVPENKEPRPPKGKSSGLASEVYEDPLATLTYRFEGRDAVEWMELGAVPARATFPLWMSWREMGEALNAIDPTKGDYVHPHAGQEKPPGYDSDVE